MQFHLDPDSLFSIYEKQKNLLRFFPIHTSREELVRLGAYATTTAYPENLKVMSQQRRRPTKKIQLISQ
jgi:hypothetical protein